MHAHLLSCLNNSVALLLLGPLFLLLVTAKQIWFCSYLSHKELEIPARKVMEELIRGCPHLRNSLVLGVAAYCSALPDESTRVSEGGRR
jgi:hypothetical protein